MLAYYLVYRNEERGVPRGVFVVDVRRGGALLWDHRRGEWSYDPDLVGRFLADYRNTDRYEDVGRPAVESVVREVTKGAALPPEDEIVSMLARGRECETRGSG
jgi:hypothetical protein